MAKKRGKASIKPDLYFVLADGKPIKNLLELVDALDDISDDTFMSHVNECKNDFSAWISNVFGEHELAKLVGKLKTRQTIQICVLRHLVLKRI